VYAKSGRNVRREMSVSQELRLRIELGINIRSKVVIEECQRYFNFDSASDIIAKRTYKFLTSFDNSDSLLCFVRHAWS